MASRAWDAVSRTVKPISKLEAEDKSNQCKNLQTEKPDSQMKSKQTVESAALCFLKVQAEVKKYKRLVKSMAKMIARLKDLDFNSFIEEANENGGFIRMEQLDKAADSGLIDKTELQNYKLDM